MPAHNERENLGWLLPHIAEVMPRLARRYEVVIVDDGSTDGTGDFAREEAERLGMELRVVRHEAMLGYGRAVADGLRETRLEYSAFTDADGQLDPADLALLVPHLADHDLVGGIRMTREDPAFRSVISGVFNWLVLRVFDIDVKDVNCALKVIKTERLHSFKLESRSALLNAELYWKTRQGGGTFTQVPVPHHPRKLGRRSGGRLIPILRASRELLLVRFKRG